MLQNIAILTGGQLLPEELGIKLENVEMSQLGKAKRVVIDKDSTTIVGEPETNPQLMAAAGSFVNR